MEHLRLQSLQVPDRADVALVESMQEGQQDVDDAWLQGLDMVHPSRLDFELHHCPQMPTESRRRGGPVVHQSADRNPELRQWVERRGRRRRRGFAARDKIVDRGEQT